MSTLLAFSSFCHSSFLVEPDIDPASGVLRDAVFLILAIGVLAERRVVGLHARVGPWWSMRRP